MYLYSRISCFDSVVSYEILLLNNFKSREAKPSVLIAFKKVSSLCLSNTSPNNVPCLDAQNRKRGCRGPVWMVHRIRPSNVFYFLVLDEFHGAVSFVPCHCGHMKCIDTIFWSYKISGCDVISVPDVRFYTVVHKRFVCTQRTDQYVV